MHHDHSSLPAMVVGQKRPSARACGARLESFGEPKSSKSLLFGKVAKHLRQYLLKCTSYTDRRIDYMEATLTINKGRGSLTHNTRSAKEKNQTWDGSLVGNNIWINDRCKSSNDLRKMYAEEFGSATVIQCNTV